MGNLRDALQKEGLSATTGREVKPAGWLGTGNYALNWAVSSRFNRGYPLGHSIEFFGEPGTGKSYLILRAIAEAQAAGGTTILDDSEHAFNPDWAQRQLEVDIDEIVVHHSSTVETHYELLTTLISYLEENDEALEDAPFVFALDSLGELTTKHEQDVGLDKPSMEKAKKLHALMRLVGDRLSSLPVAYFVANHIYSGAGGWGNQTKSHGGRALEYKASVRIKLRSVKKIKGKGGDITGVFVRARVAKNRVAPPFREVEMAIPYNEPISKYSGLIPILLNIGVIETTGRTIAYQGEDTGIYVQKTNPLKQIRSAEELVAEYPEILDEADKVLAANEVGGQSIYDDELVEDEDEET